MLAKKDKCCVLRKDSSIDGFLEKISSSNPLITLSNPGGFGAIFLTLKCHILYLKESNNNNVGRCSS
jgi:hypothetical protein